VYIFCLLFFLFVIFLVCTFLACIYLTFIFMFLFLFFGSVPTVLEIMIDSVSIFFAVPYDKMIFNSRPHWFL